MSDYSDVIPMFAYVGLLFFFFIGFVAVSYLAYKEGRRKRRRSRYGHPTEEAGDSFFGDAASALAAVLFLAWAVHGLSLLRSFSPDVETYDFAVSPWSVATYWAVAFGICFAYVRLLKRGSPISTVAVGFAFLFSFFWLAWGFGPLNDFFVTWCGGAVSGLLWFAFKRRESKRKSKGTSKWTSQSVGCFCS